MTVSYSLACTSYQSASSYDLTSNRGIADYWDQDDYERAAFFKHPLNGKRHNWVPLKKLACCQYCYYILHDEIEKRKQKHLKSQRIHSCLVCNVNLCPMCDPIFHGEDFSSR